MFSKPRIQPYVPIETILCFSTPAKAKGSLNSLVEWEGDIQTAAIPEGFMPLTKNGMVKYTKLSAGSNGLIVAALSNDESTFSSYLWINTADGNTGVAEDRGPGLPEERLIVVCEKEKAFLIFGTDGVIRMVSGTNGELIKEIQIAYGISDIANISFLNNDANLAVWTKSSCYGI